MLYGVPCYIGLRNRTTRWTCFQCLSSAERDLRCRQATAGQSGDWKSWGTAVCGALCSTLLLFSPVVGNLPWKALGKFSSLWGENSLCPTDCVWDLLLHPTKDFSHFSPQTCYLNMDKTKGWINIKYCSVPRWVAKALLDLSCSSPKSNMRKILVTQRKQ